MFAHYYGPIKEEFLNNWHDGCAHDVFDVVEWYEEFGEGRLCDTDGLYDRIMVDWGGWAYRCSKDYFSEKLIASKHLEGREIAVLDVELW